MTDHHVHEDKKVSEEGFIQLPKALLHGDGYAHLSIEAVVLFVVMLDRIKLSEKEGWRDKNNRVYIYLTIEEACSILRCKDSKACRVIKELERAGLIERVRQGRNRPSRIYVLRQ